MTPAGPEPELPPDLQLLGDQLERAAGRSLRRRARRQGILNAIAAVALAVPLALAVSAGELSPSTGQESDALRSAPVVRTPTAGELAHIRDETVPPPPPVQCLDANDCRSPAPRSAPLPVGRV
jgi:hypothetical protein